MAATMAQTTTHGPWRLAFPKPHVAEIEIDCFGLADAVHDDWRQSVEATTNYLSRDTRIKAVVLVVGSTLTEAHCGRGPPTAEQISNEALYTSLWAIELKKFDKPIICLIDGLCTPSGLRIACIADVRLCTSKTDFLLWDSEASQAAVPELIQILSGIVNPCSLFRELAFSRETFNADEAYKLGLVSTVSSSSELGLQRSYELAQNISRRHSKLTQKLMAAVRNETPKMIAKVPTSDAYTEEMIQADINQALGYYGPDATVRARL